MKQTKKHDIFNLPFTQTLSINVLVVLDKHFLPNSNLHKISNINTVNFSYSCIPNVGSIIKSYNKKLINAENKQTKDGNCKKRKNARWKVNVDLNIYTNVQLQQQIIPKKCTQVQQKVTLSNDVTATKSHLKVENMQIRHHFQSASGKQKLNTIPPKSNVVYS